MIEWIKGNITKLMYLLAMTSMLFMIMVYFLYTNQGDNPIYLLSKDGQLKPLNQFSGPIASKKVVENWAEDVILDIYNISYSDFAFQEFDFAGPYYERVARYFTKESYQTGFFSKLPNSDLISDVKKGSFRYTPYLLKPAKIVSWGYIGDSYYWVVEVPIHITKTSQYLSNALGQDKVVSVTVKNIPARRSLVGMNDLEAVTMIDRIRGIPSAIGRFVSSLFSMITTGSVTKDAAKECGDNCIYTVFAIEGFMQQNLSPDILNPGV